MSRLKLKSILYAGVPVPLLADVGDVVVAGNLGQPPRQRQSAALVKHLQQQQAMGVSQQICIDSSVNHRTEFMQ